MKLILKTIKHAGCFFWRTIVLTFLSAAFFVALVATIPFGVALRAKIFRYYLQFANGAFLKIGQLLSMRYDLLHPAYCQELALLLDSLPEVPFPRIKLVLERSYQKPLNAIFSSISQKPLGSASIAQVHEGVLSTGEQIVLKVLKPGTKQLFSTDFFYLRLLGGVLNFSGLFGKIDIKAFLVELIKLTREEFDFRREARNLNSMHRLMSADEIDHYTPKPFLLHCTDEVIVMEKITGVSVRAMILAMESSDFSALEKWKIEGICPRRSSRIILRSMLEQTMRHRIYHADPHSANLIVMKGGTVAWIDFGMTGWLDEKMWYSQFSLRSALVQGNLHEGYRHFLMSLGNLPNKDLSAFESEIKEAFRDWVEASNDPNAGLQEKSSGHFFIRVFLALRKAGISLPTGLSRLYRAIIIADMAMLKLDPLIDWVPVMREFIQDEFERQSKESFGKLLKPLSWFEWAEKIGRLPEMYSRVADWVYFTLPEFSNVYSRQISAFSKLTFMGIQIIRNASLAALLYLVGLRIFDLPVPAPKAISENLFTHWNLVIISIILLIFVSQKSLQQLDS